MNVVVPEWVQDAVFYQIFPDRFAKSNQYEQYGYPPKPTNLQAWGETPTYHGFQGGDLAGIAERLDYLSDLGITAIYLNPIFASAANHRYHTHDYYTVDPILGGNDAFRDFLDAAHQRDMRVVLDGVFNHTGRGFFQFNHLMECGEESPYVDWFHVHRWPINAFDESEPPTYDAWWGLHSLPKLNTDSTAVREFLWHVGTHWLKQGIDGWRLDVPNEINDDEFWQTFRQRCKAVNPEAYIVGELWWEAERWLQGDQFDGQMNYLFTRAALGFLAGEQMDQSDTVRSGLGYIKPLNGRQFAEECERIFNQLYHPQITLSQLNMLGSHDTPRLMTVANGDETAVQLSFLCQMTVPGAPNIYYGDEIGMTGRHDPYCRRAFPWHVGKPWNVSLRESMQKYISLRHETPALRRGDFKILQATKKLVIYRRQYEGETAVVALNADSKPQKFRCPDAILHHLGEKLAITDEPLIGGKTYTVPGRNGRVWAG